MKVDPDADVVGDWADLLTGTFETGLPGVSTINAQWADPASKYLTSPKQLGRAYAENGVRAFRAMSARAGVDVGVPLGVIGDFTQALSLAGSDQAVNGWIDFVSTSTQAIIDVACDAMGAVPFVGWLARGINVALTAIGKRIADGRPKPPLLAYDKTNDEDIVRTQLGDARSLDWTFMFGPPGIPETWADWEIVKASDGFLMRPEAKFSVSSNYIGALPGGAFGSRAVQSRNCWGNMPSLEPEAPGGIVDVGAKNLDRISGAYKTDYQRATDCIVDVYDTTPSVARVALATWQSMTQRRTANLWQVDTRGIADAWEAYTSTGIEASRVHSAAVTQFGGQKWLAWRNLEAAMYVRGWKLGGAPDGPQRTATLAYAAKQYIDDLRRRQRKALDTVLVAYAQEGQAAFADKAMRDLLVKRRGELLTADARWGVDPKDVIDADFRGALEQATRPEDRPKRTPAPDDRLPRYPTDGSLPLPTPDPERAGTGGGGLGLFLGGLGLAAAAVGGWYVYRHR